MISIGFFGDGLWAHEAFKKIINDTEIDVCFVSVRFDNRDSILTNMADEHRIPVELFKNINSDESFEILQKYDADLFVSMSFNQIFRSRTINLPRLKTINCHAGKLPFYRGRNILNWVLINDEREFGITVHYIDEGIDTGNIYVKTKDTFIEVIDYDYDGRIRIGSRLGEVIYRHRQNRGVSIRLYHNRSGPPFPMRRQAA